MGHLQTVQQIYQAFGRGDVPAIIEQLAEDVEWEHDSVDHGIPWLTPGRGRQHVLGFFGVVGKEFDISRFEVTGLFANDNQVIATIQIETTIQSTGKRIRDLEVHLWTFAPNGRVAKFRHVVDTHQHLQASLR